MKKRRIWIGIVVLLMIIAGYGISSSKQALTVDMGTVARTDMDEYVEEIATVHLKDEISLYAPVSGKIVEITRNIGDMVKSGEPLVKMDNQEMILEDEVLKAQKRALIAQYQEAKKEVDNEELNKLRAQIKSAEASYGEAKRSMENNKKLYEEKAISYDMYRKAEVTLTGAETELEVAKSNLALAQRGLSNNIAQKYDAQISEIQTRIEILNKKQNDLILKAPMDGVVMIKEVEVGNIVQSGDLLLEIGGEQGIYLESDILMDEIAMIQPGATVWISNEDLGVGQVRGTLRKVHPKAFNKTSDLGIEQKRVKVEIDFDQDVSNLKPGYDMDIKIITASNKNTLVVDENAVFEYQNKDCVFVNEEGIAKLRTIKKGLESDERIEILDGLKEGEKVILSPDEEIQEGMKIR